MSSANEKLVVAKNATTEQLNVVMLKKWKLLSNENSCRRLRSERSIQVSRVGQGAKKIHKR